MEVLKALVAQILAEQLPAFTIPELEVLMENTCVKILQEIQTIVRDDSLDDPTCFAKIEKIVCALEAQHIPCTPRHDFV